MCWSLKLAFWGPENAGLTQANGQCILGGSDSLTIQAMAQCRSLRESHTER